MDIMIDLETLGTDSDAAILSIGAVAFDKTGPSLSLEESRKFYSNVDLQSCLDAGLTTNADTIYWWLKRPEEARKDLVNPEPKPLGIALEEFTFWLYQFETIWSHGATFDIVILKNAYKAMRMKCPWHYTAERDTRTLLSFKNKHVHGDNKHNALYDAYNQAVAIQACYDIYNVQTESR